jgi:hypothetical protein
VPRRLLNFLTALSLSGDARVAGDRAGAPSERGMLLRVNPLTKSCPTYRWAWGALHLLAAIALLVISGWLAALLVPVPEGTFTGDAAESASKVLRRQWWASLVIYAAMCVLAFYFLPLAWRRWHDRGQPGTD